MSVKRRRVTEVERGGVLLNPVGLNANRMLNQNFSRRDEYRKGVSGESKFGAQMNLSRGLSGATSRRSSVGAVGVGKLSFIEHPLFAVVCLEEE